MDAKNVGMLWFDNDQKNSTLKDKVAHAAAHYQRKYNKTPNLCLVHPSAIVDEKQVSNVTIRANRAILPGHVWIGIDEAKA